MCSNHLLLSKVMRSATDIAGSGEWKAESVSGASLGDVVVSYGDLESPKPDLPLDLVKMHKTWLGAFDVNSQPLPQTTLLLQPKIAMSDV